MRERSVSVKTMSIPVIEANGLSKAFGPKIALRDVSFAIAAGEVLGVVGPNGAGKSTIVKIVTGLLESERGNILFHGEPVRNRFDEFRAAMGYVPEQTDLYGFLTGWEYVELVASLRGLGRSVFRRRAIALFDAFRLGEARMRPISGYSKGMRQRVALIAALIHNPSFLVLDEPFSGLDVSSVLLVRRLIQAIAQKGAAVFFSSPSLDHMEQVSTRLLILRDGQVLAAGQADEVRKRLGGMSLEAGFVRMADPSDIDSVALRVLEAIAE